MRVTITGKTLRVNHAGCEVAVHERRSGRFERVTDPAHFEGVVGFRSKAVVAPAPAAEPTLLPPCGVRAAHRRELVMDQDPLIAMLTRLKLTAIRDQLDSLIDNPRRQLPPAREAAIGTAQGSSGSANDDGAGMTRACPGGRTGTSRAPLRQTRGGRSAARGSLLCTTWTSLTSTLGAQPKGGPVLAVAKGPVPDVD